MRGFKTDRSIEAEQKRNPTMTSRLKTALSNAPQKIDGETPFQAEKLRRLLAKADDHGGTQNAVRMMS